VHGKDRCGTRDVSREQRALGRAVREIRARRCLSQEELGFGARLHRNYVGAVERGEINATFATLLKLTVGLRMPLSELIAVYERQLADGPQGR
jgi:transcriptional regulator with XRE-family HTH domain